MNGKRARALRKVALETAIQVLPPREQDGTIPYRVYVQQPHRNRHARWVATTVRLGPCIRKIEKEAKREYYNLARAA